MTQKLRFRCGVNPYSPCRLLIPTYLLEVFTAKMKKFGCMEALFNYIVNHPHRVYKKTSISRYGRTTYQLGGLRLKKKDFFPLAEDWEKFRTYANLQRVSMTLLFVMILEDWDGFEDEMFGTPRIPEKIHLNQSLIITEIFTYIEIERFLL